MKIKLFDNLIIKHHNQTNINMENMTVTQWKPNLLFTNVEYVSDKYYLVNNRGILEIYNRFLEKIKEYDIDKYFIDINKRPLHYSFKIVNDKLYYYESYGEYDNYNSCIKFIDINEKEFTELDGYFCEEISSYHNIHTYYDNKYSLFNDQTIYLNNHKIIINYVRGKYYYDMFVDDDIKIPINSYENVIYTLKNNILIFHSENNFKMSIYDFS